GVSKALVEADPQALCVTGVHQNHRLKSSVGFSAVFGRVFVHFVNGSGMLELHPETGEFTSCEGGWPSQAYRLVTGGQGAPCCALVPMRVFDTHLRVNAQACSLHRIWPDGRSRLLSVFAGGNCSDIAVLPRRDGFSVFVASSGTIMKHDFGEEQ
ncbi:MAG: hypothetical protein Q7I92_14820, partial [Humidesulfovibrio sp.]|nr:hypothetical protein [Humidesulfovibrio sp.]